LVQISKITRTIEILVQSKLCLEISAQKLVKQFAWIGKIYSDVVDNLFLILFSFFQSKKMTRGKKGDQTCDARDDEMRFPSRSSSNVLLPYLLGHFINFRKTKPQNLFQKLMRKCSALQLRDFNLHEKLSILETILKKKFCLKMTASVLNSAWWCITSI